MGDRTVSTTTGADEGPLEAGTIDLTDLDRFVHGFPHEVFTTLRRHAPVWWHPPTDHTPDGEGFWVLSRHADIQAVAGDAGRFSSAVGGGRPGGGTLIEDLPAGFAAGVLLNMMDDPRHQQIRKLLTPSVSQRALAAMEPELVAGQGNRSTFSLELTCPKNFDKDLIRSNVSVVVFQTYIKFFRDVA